MQLLIPVPPIEVQEEIVRVLDSFAELEARRRQYAYYCDQLLTFNKPEIERESLSEYCKWTSLKEIAQYRRGSFPQPYTNSEWYGGEGAMPFVQVADVAEYGFRLTDSTKQTISKVAQPKSVFVPRGTIVVSLQGSIGRVAITQYDSFVDRTLAIFTKIDESCLPKYFVYQLARIFSIKKENARGTTIKTITKAEFSNFKIPLPPLSEQQRIVDILDKFDALVNDISQGLPAEIEARRKQYEYYRDKLLTFKKKED